MILDIVNDTDLKGASGKNILVAQIEDVSVAYRSNRAMLLAGVDILSVFCRICGFFSVNRKTSLHSRI